MNPDYEVDLEEPEVTEGGEQKGQTQTDAGSAQQEEGEPRASRRQSINNRLGFLTRTVARQDRQISTLMAELDSERHRGRAAQVTQHVGEAEAQVEGQIRAATKRLSDAIADGKSEEAAAINLEIARLSVRQARLQEHRDTIAARQRDDSARQPGGGGQQEPEHIAEWKDQNSDWFNMQPRNNEQFEMTKFALETERELNAKGYELNSPRMLNAITQRVQDRFASYFGLPEGKSTARGGGVVDVDVDPPQTRSAPASRFAAPTPGGTSAPRGSKKVSLTRDQIEMAKSMGMTPVQYAQNL
jgi:hypothetical protein